MNMESENSKSTSRYTVHKARNEREDVGYFTDSELIVWKVTRRWKRRRISNIQDNSSGVVRISFGMVFSIFVILLSYLVCSRMESAELRMELEDAKENILLLQEERSQTLKMLEREKYEKIQANREKDKMFTFFEMEKNEKLEMLGSEKNEKMQLLQEERIKCVAMLEGERRDKMKMEQKIKEQMELMEKNFEELLKEAISQESNSESNFSEWSDRLLKVVDVLPYSQGKTTSGPNDKTQKRKTKRKSNRQKKLSSPKTNKRTNQKSEKTESSWWDHINVVLDVASIFNRW